MWILECREHHIHSGDPRLELWELPDAHPSPPSTTESSPLRAASPAPQSSKSPSKEKRQVQRTIIHNESYPDWLARTSANVRVLFAFLFHFHLLSILSHQQQHRDQEVPNDMPQVPSQAEAGLLYAVKGHARIFQDRYVPSLEKILSR